jgi:hypothetical protein
MAEERKPLASVDQVREQLRRLGYLESGLDRFVLGDAGAPSPLRACFGAAARVGIAAGALLGATLTLAAASLDRSLLGEPRDLVVLGLYLALALGLAAALAALAFGLLAGWAARRRLEPGPALPRQVGLAFALGGLGYLALWWRSHGGDASLLAQAAALSVGLGLALLLGRFGSLAAVAVLSAGGASLPEARLSRRHLALFVATAGALFALGLGASYFGQQAAAQSPDFAVVPTSLRLHVLGIDGLERRMTEQRIEHGEMPQLAALRARGAWARLQSEPERIPAIVWTTIATGRGPEAHRIQATGSRRLAGMRTPVPLAEPEGVFGTLAAATDLLRLTRKEPPSSALRGAKAFWNVASEKGLHVGVVNWWATWPCDAVNGYVVSDRTFFRLERGGAPDREACPADVFERVKDLRPAERDRARALDLFYLAAARRLREGSAPDLDAVYLPGLDITTMQQLGDASASDVATLDTRLAAVRDYYRFLDERIGEAAAGLGPSEILVLLGDPGRLARRASEAAEGILLIAGGPVLARQLGSVSERDLAPTVLHLAGLPVSRELSGRVIEAAFAPEFLSLHAIRYVSSYGRRPRAPAAESAFDAQVVEELKSLGYVQ